MSESTAVALRPEVSEVVPPTIRPAMSVDDAVAQLAMMRDFRKRVLKKDTDYGVIPGVDKPSLFKPGAEKLANIFALAVQFEEVAKVEDWEKGFFTYTYKAIVRSRRDGEIVAECVGSCNSLEDKYRYRVVPEWEAKPEDKERALKNKRKKTKNGWKTFYYLPNNEPFSLVNTIQKMAQKRAMVGAILIATRASEEYTQDVEDLDPVVEEEQHERSEAAPPAPPHAELKQRVQTAPRGFNAAGEPIMIGAKRSSPLFGKPIHHLTDTQIAEAAMWAAGEGDEYKAWLAAAEAELETRRQKVAAVKAESYDEVPKAIQDLENENEKSPFAPARAAIGGGK